MTFLGCALILVEKEVKLDEQDLCRSTNNYKPDDH